MTKFNLIGFGWPQTPKEYRHCIVHPGSRLIPNVEQGVLFCPLCGTNYLEKDTSTEERFIPKFGPQSSTTRIMTPKKDKKYFDQSGNEINDEQLLKDMAQGAHVISYHEYKSGDDKPIVKRNSHQN